MIDVPSIFKLIRKVVALGKSVPEMEKSTGGLHKLD